MKWKMLALDLDGTLLDEHGNLSQENMDGVRRAFHRGLTIALVSGRHRSRVAPVAELLQLHVPFITTNGCEVWSSDGRLIERNVLPWKDVEYIHRLAFQHQVPYRAYCAEGVFESSRGHLAQLDYSWLKVLLQDESGHGLGELHHRLKQRARFELVPYGANPLEPQRLDIMPAGTGKTSGLRTLCATLGIRPDEVIAFGDDRNDIEMLTWAGFGVAMGNAPDDVKAAADAIAPTNVDSGVARTLSQLIPDMTA